VTSWGSPTATGWGSTTVTGWGSTTVTGWGPMTVTSWGSATLFSDGSAARGCGIGAGLVGWRADTGSSGSARPNGWGAHLILVGRVGYSDNGV
jgi:hypothetical protein